MKSSLSAKVAFCLLTAVAVGGSTSKPNRLTLRRVAELTAPSKELQSNVFKVEISGMSRSTKKEEREAVMSVIVSPERPVGVLEQVREFRFPIAFSPPRAAPEGDVAALIPTTPAEFETVDTGWKIHVTAKPEGKLVAVYGIADFTVVDYLPGGYGALAGPIYSNDGKLVMPNVVQQPRFQTTSSRFHIFAIPGESYEVTLYRGEKPEKHTVRVIPQ